MSIRSKAGRARKGVIKELPDGRFLARVRWIEYVDGKKKEREKTKIAIGKKVAQTTLHELLIEAALEVEQENITDKRDDMLFSDLADIYKLEEIQEVVFEGKKKVSGMRGTVSATSQLKNCVAYFGTMTLKEIVSTPSKIQDFKTWFAHKRTKKGTLPSVAYVNHQLRRMRIVLNFAIRKGLIVQSPFKMLKGIIEESQEAQREYIPDAEMQARILAQCSGRRAHLKDILILIRDTAVRPAELFRMLAEDVDFEKGIVTITEENAKTKKKRIMSMTADVQEVLHKRIVTGELAGHQRVFPCTTFRRSYATACRRAGITNPPDPYSWRHAAITEMLEAGESREKIMATSGHSQDKTFRRYLKFNHESIGSVARNLEEHRRQRKGSVIKIRDYDAKRQVS